MSESHKTPLIAILAQMQELDTKQLRAIEYEARRLIEEQEEQQFQPEAKAGEIERRTLGSWCYIHQLINCGKAACKKCSGRHYKHGPYWYAYSKVNGKVRSIYIGKTLKLIDSPPASTAVTFQPEQ